MRILAFAAFLISSWAVVPTAEAQTCASYCATFNQPSNLGCPPLTSPFYACFTGNAYCLSPPFYADPDSTGRCSCHHTPGQCCDFGDCLAGGGPFEDISCTETVPASMCTPTPTPPPCPPLPPNGDNCVFGCYTPTTYGAWTPDGTGRFLCRTSHGPCPTACLTGDPSEADGYECVFDPMGFCASGATPTPTPTVAPTSSPSGSPSSGSIACQSGTIMCSTYDQYISTTNCLMSGCILCNQQAPGAAYDLDGTGRCSCTTTRHDYRGPGCVGAADFWYYRTCTGPGGPATCSPTPSPTASPVPSSSPGPSGTPTGIVFTPNTHDYGTISTGSSTSALSIQITNYTGSNATSCTYSYDATNFTLVGAGACASIAAGGTCGVQLTANPTTDGAKSTAITANCTIGSSSPAPSVGPTATSTPTNCSMPYPINPTSMPGCSISSSPCQPGSIDYCSCCCVNITPPNNPICI